MAAPAAWAATPINETRPLDPRGHDRDREPQGPHPGARLGQARSPHRRQPRRGRREARDRRRRRRPASCAWNTRKRPQRLAQQRQHRADRPAPERAGARRAGDRIGLGRPSTSSAPPAARCRSTASAATSSSPARRAKPTSKASAAICTLTLNSARCQRVESVSGDLNLRGKLDGEMSVETVSGNIEADSGGKLLRHISASTVSGDVKVRAGLQNGGEFKSESVSGDLHLTLPKNTSAQVSGETFSGDLNAPGAKIERPKYGPGASFEHRYGSGNGGDPHRDLLRRRGTCLRVRGHSNTRPGSPFLASSLGARRKPRPFLFSAITRFPRHWRGMAQPARPSGQPSLRERVGALRNLPPFLREIWATSARADDRQPRPAPGPRVAADRHALRRQADHRRGGAPGRPGRRRSNRSRAAWRSGQLDHLAVVAGRSSSRWRSRPTCSAAWSATPTRCCRSCSPTPPACA